MMKVILLTRGQTVENVPLDETKLLSFKSSGQMSLTSS